MMVRKPGVLQLLKQKYRAYMKNVLVLYTLSTSSNKASGLRRVLAAYFLVVEKIEDRRKDFTLMK